MDSRQPGYRSFLLRLWWAGDEDDVTLRIYVEDPQSGERTGFANLDELTAFLRRVAGLHGESDGEPGLASH